MYLCRVRIVFFGTPDFAAHSLKKIVEAGFEVVGVVTSVDKPAGRGRRLQSSAVKEAAVALGLPISQPSNLKSEAFLDQLKLWQPDLGVVIAFRMMPESVWSFPKLGTVNLHASLLPDYRGAAPIQHAIINGEEKTGVSTFFLKHEIDTGDIIDQASVPIPKEMNAGALHDTLMLLGADIMIQTLRKIEAFGDQTPVYPQNNLGISHKIAPKLSREFAELDTQSSQQAILCKIRGLSPYPGAWIKSPWGDMKVLQAEASSEVITVNQFEIRGKHLLLGLKNGSISLQYIQLAGKSKMSAQDFINGFAKKN